MTSPSLRRLLAGVCGLTLALASSVPASRGQDDPPPRTVDPTKAKWLPLLQKQAREYQITAEGSEGKKTSATMLRDPLMRWTQPVRGGDDGVLCLWVDRGRPVVAMTIFTFKGGDGLRYIGHKHQ